MEGTALNLRRVLPSCVKSDLKKCLLQIWLNLLAFHSFPWLSCLLTEFSHFASWSKLFSGNLINAIYPKSKCYARFCSLFLNSSVGGNYVNISKNLRSLPGRLYLNCEHILDYSWNPNGPTFLVSQFKLFTIKPHMAFNCTHCETPTFYLIPNMYSGISSNQPN